MNDEKKMNGLRKAVMNIKIKLQPIVILLFVEMLAVERVFLCCCILLLFTIESIEMFLFLIGISDDSKGIVASSVWCVLLLIALSVTL